MDVVEAVLLVALGTSYRFVLVDVGEAAYIPLEIFRRTMLFCLDTKF